MLPRREAIENVPDDEVGAALIAPGLRGDEIERGVKELELADITLEERKRLLDRSNDKGFEAAAFPRKAKGRKPLREELSVREGLSHGVGGLRRHCAGGLSRTLTAAQGRDSARAIARAVPLHCAGGFPPEAAETLSGALARHGYLRSLRRAAKGL